jgi:putative transposase
MDENILWVASTPSPPYPRDGLIMLTFSHYNFCKRLLDKARNYKDTNVLIVNEAYTSKTCTCCGTIHNKLGGNKTFDCRSCS